MNRTPVVSSNIRSIGYDQSAQILEIEFTSGSIYKYFNIPININSGLMSASSKGRYFAENIKDLHHYRNK